MAQVLTITGDPVFNVVSVYRPILFTINVSDTQPPKAVYCDVYVNDVFYRTLVKTQYSSLAIGSSNWIFDIQVPCQEVLSTYLPGYGGHKIILARPCTAKVVCKFRGSTIDANGFLVPEATAPVQATGTTPAVGGTGLESMVLYAVNVALQHKNNQLLSVHLPAYANGTWSVDALPMSHRPNNYVVAKADNDYYPIFYNGSGTLSKLKLFYRNQGQLTWFNTTHAVDVVNEVDGSIGAASFYYTIVLNGDGTQTVTYYWPVDGSLTSVDVRYDDGTTHAFSGSATPPRSITIPVGTYAYSMVLYSPLGDAIITSDIGFEEVSSAPVTKGLFYIPNGPKNLTSLFPSIVWANLAEYYVQVLDDSDVVVSTSRVNKIQEWFNADHARVYFLNFCGTYDAINLLKPKTTLEDSSSEYQKTVGFPLVKSAFSTARSSVRFNNTKEVKRNSTEEEMPWLEECKTSPEAYEDWTGIEGQASAYSSVVILNGKVDALKNVGEFNYEFILQYKQSNEGFSVRN
jgi:hypothetical protein